ncbi:MAG TPA: ABC transporter permease [Vicinamibacterales bacterium]|nr:ABC transporter permease [Vicinamibacterales bacterium]
MLLNHLRHAIRLLVREPGFSAAAILTLALGVGANIAVFAVVEAVLLRPLPYTGADQLLILNHRDRRTGVTKEFIAMGDFVDIAARQTTLEGLSAYGAGPITIYGEQDPRLVTALHAGPGLFEILRVAPALGRGLTSADAAKGAPPVALIGHELWEQYFGSDPNIIGRGIRVGNEQRQIVGVAPRGFRFPPSMERTDVVLPMSVPAQAPAVRKSSWALAVGRLKPESTIEMAASNVSAIAAQLEREHASQNQGSEYFPVSLRTALVGDTRTALLLMFAAVAVVLVVACANVGNLMLARALGRRHEMAVRAALGAGRLRLLAQLVAESLVLAIVAGMTGLAIAYWGAPALVTLVPQSVATPGLREVGVNGAVVAFAIGLIVVTAIASSVLAALAVRSDAAAALGTRGEAGPGRATRRAASALIAAEVALALVLLASAGLILRSFSGLLAVDPGFRPDHVLTMDVALPPDRYAQPPARRAFYDRAFAELQQLPGIEHAGAAAVTPLTGNNWTVPFERRDRPVPAGERPPDVGWQVASGAFFSALRIPLLQGRLFDARDAPSSPPVVIISTAIRKQYFPNEDPIGMKVRLGDADAEIVGVVGDIRRAGLTDALRADMYLPFELSPPPGTTLFIRTSGDPLQALPQITSALRHIEPRLVVGDTVTLAAIARESMSTTRLLLWLLGVFSVVALALAFVGVYGVMSYSVRQRSREIGTRMALGATRADILWTVMRHGLAIAAIGVAVGLAATVAASQSLAAVLYGVSATDGMTLAVAAATLAVATLAASYVPARRAAHLDPARTLAE